jgi:hypothetical protein
MNAEGDHTPGQYLRLSVLLLHHGITKVAYVKRYGDAEHRSLLVRQRYRLVRVRKIAHHLNDDAVKAVGHLGGSSMLSPHAGALITKIGIQGGGCCQKSRWRLEGRYPESPGLTEAGCLIFLNPADAWDLHPSTQNLMLDSIELRARPGRSGSLFRFSGTTHHSFSLNGRLPGIASNAVVKPLGGDDPATGRHVL